MNDEFVPLTNYLRIILRHKLLVGAVMLGCILTVGIKQQFFTKSVYRAEGTLIPKKKTSSSASLALSMLSSSGMSLGGASDMSYDLTAILKSRMLARFLIDKYDLQEKYKKQLNKKYSKDGLTKRLAGSISYDTNKQGTIIIFFSETDPKLAADMANIYMHGLLQLFDSFNKQDNSEKIRYIENQIVRTENRLHKLEIRLKDFEKSQTVFAVDKEMSATMQSYYNLKLQYEKDRIEREALHKQFELRNRMMQDADPLAIDSKIYVSDPVLQNLKAKMSEVQLEIIKNQELLKPDNPLLKQNRLKLESLTQQLKDYTSSLQNNTLNDILFNMTAFDSKMSAEKEMLQNYEKSFDPLPDKKLALTRLVRDQKIYEAMYVYLKQELEKSKIELENTVVPARVLDEAEKPQARFSPRVKVAVAIAGFSGLMLGIVLAFIVDMYQRLKSTTPAGTEQNG